MAQFSLQWDSYKQNICDGLSGLQQSGELVDVTLAADGHLVRVHRVVLALSSPYLKELLASATDCSHPVVFLNKVSYHTLSSILEYIYNGQAMVTKEHLPDLVQAAKELRIKGLEDMDEQFSVSPGHPSASKSEHSKAARASTSGNQTNSELPDYTLHVEDTGYNIPNITLRSENLPESTETVYLDDDALAEQSDHHTTFDEMDTDMDRDPEIPKITKIKTIRNTTNPNTRFSYTLSSQGGLQIILNRYIYNCRYTSKVENGHSQWKCVEYTKRKCKAMLITQNDVIVKRSGLHNHPYHDQKILKKVRDNIVFASIKDAESKTIVFKKAAVRRTQPNLFIRKES